MDAKTKGKGEETPPTESCELTLREKNKARWKLHLEQNGSSERQTLAKASAPLIRTQDPLAELNVYVWCPHPETARKERWMQWRDKSR